MGQRGQIVDRSCSQGLSIKEFWCAIFEFNELAWKGDVRYVLEDGKVVSLVQKAFPNRFWSRALRDARSSRAAYNRGKLSLKQTKPEEVSYRYVRYGETVFREDPNLDRKQKVKSCKEDLSSTVEVFHVCCGELPKPKQ